MYNIYPFGRQPEEYPEELHTKAAWLSINELVNDCHHLQWEKQLELYSFNPSVAFVPGLPAVPKIAFLLATCLNYLAFVKGWCKLYSLQWIILVYTADLLQTK